MISTTRPLICLITNRKALAPDARTFRAECAALAAQVAAAAAAGVDLVQVREADLEARQLEDLVIRLMAVATGHARLLVNDRADVAVAVGAHGVHLRADGPPSGMVRALGSEGWIVGRSIHSAEEARRSGDADYLLFGTVFTSRSKPAGTPVAGMDALAAAVAGASVPVLAIGGVSPSGAAACRSAGAAGVAAIELFLPAGRMPGALGPAAAVKALREAWSALE